MAGQEFIVTTNTSPNYLAAGYFTPGPAQAFDEIRNDKQVAFSIEPVLQNQQGGVSPFSADFLDTDVLSMAIGNFDTAPTGGTVSLQVGSTTTGLTAISGTVTAGALQTALNAALTTEAKPLCVVTELTDGNYQIVAATNGAITDGFFTVVSAANLYPLSNAFFTKGDNGSASTKYQYIFVMRQAPMCFAQLADGSTGTLLPAPDVQVVTVQAGSGSANHIQQISFTVAQVYSGNYYINATADGTTATCGTATPLMTAAELGAVLAQHEKINYNTPFEDDNVAITQVGQTWNVEFIGTLANSNANLITVANNDLIGPEGLSGTIDYNTYGLYIYSLSQTGNSFRLTRTIQRTRASGEVRTLYNGSVTIYKDLIDASTSVPTPSAAYFTSTESDARYLRSSANSNLTTGNTLTVDSGATLAVSGSLSGTPTGGTLNLSNLALTLPSLSKFKATKGGTDQTVTANTLTKVTWPTESWDIGNNFASDKWTPPAGKVRLSAMLYSFTNTTGNNTLSIYKNGSEFGRFAWFDYNSNAQTSSMITVEDNASGTDFYEVFAQINGATTWSGSAIFTWFTGEVLS